MGNVNFFTVSLLLLFYCIHPNYGLAQCPPSKQDGIHVVQSGENLYRISLKYNVSVAAICSWNNMEATDVLFVCKKLKVKAPSNSKAIPASYSKKGPDGPSLRSKHQYVRQPGTSHTVREGEDIAGLADLYGYTERRFREINYMKPTDKVVIGSILVTDHCGSSPTGDSSSPTPPGGLGESAKSGNPQPSRPSVPPASNSAADNSADASTPAPNAPYMSKLEWSMIDEINLMRGNPAGYIKYIEEYKNSKRAKTVGLNPTNLAELIKELKNTSPLSILKPAECIYDAAKGHGEDMKRRGRMGHKGSDGSMPWERVTRSCSKFQDGNENLVGGPDNVRESVVILLIDQGISTHGHRHTLLNPHWTHMACYKVGTVGDMPHSWVQNFGQERDGSADGQDNRTAARRGNSTPRPQGGSTSRPSLVTHSPPASNNPPSNPNPSDSGGASTPAPNAPYMSELEWSMLEEINLVRGNPAGYIKYIEEYKNSKRAKMVGLNEATVNELIAELRRTPKLSILKPAECIYNAAKEHGEDMKRRGRSGHQGSDGSMPWDRVRHACKGWKDGNENLVGGPDNVRQSVIILLIDEGISTRGHRRTLLNSHWTHAACYKVGTVGSMPHSWVQNFGEGRHESEGSSNSQPSTAATNTQANNGSVSQPSSSASSPSPPSNPTPNPSDSADANTPAPKAPYMSELEWSMIEEINLVRGNPAGYIKYIEEYKNSKRAKMVGLNEATVNELIAELRNTPKLSILKPEECIYGAAKEHGEDMKRRGRSGHKGSDGSMPWDRVRHACKSWKDGNENLVGGPDNVRQSVIILLIDEGISTRGHRHTLLNPIWTHVACYKVGTVGSMPHSWVQNFGQEADRATTNQASAANTPASQPSPTASSSPAPKAAYMSDLEWSMLEEINLVRGNPAGYIKYIEEYKNSKRAKLVGLNEATVNELIEELRNTPKLSILQPAECIYNAAKEHGEDMKRRGRSGHKGSDGSMPWDRVRHACKSWKDGNENLVGGPDNVRQSVIILLIDEGISTRGHRRTLLNPIWTHAACYKVGTVGSMPHSWVQNFGQE